MEIENRGPGALDLSAFILLQSDPARMGEGLLQVIAAAHPLDAALGVHNPLLARVEGVAFAAHFYAQRGLGGAGVEYVATGTGHCGIIKIRVNVCFHYLPVGFDDLFANSCYYDAASLKKIRQARIRRLFIY